MNDFVPRLTLDTNLLLELWKAQDRKGVMETLIDLARRGEVDLAVTARIREDVPREPLASEIDKLPELEIKETGSITRLGFWIIGRDGLASDDFTAYEEELKARTARTGKKVPDWRDLDHVQAHFLQDRDAFLTWDKPILALAEELRSRFGIVVMPPEVYLQSRPLPRTRAI